MSKAFDMELFLAGGSHTTRQRHLRQRRLSKQQ